MMQGVNDIQRLSVLSEPMRLDILTVIASSGSCCANDILSHFDISQPTLSHHMKLLIENKLVLAKKDGRFVRYTINNAGIEELKSLLDLFITDNSAFELHTDISTVIPEKDTKKKKKTDKKKKDKKKKK